MKFNKNIYNSLLNYFFDSFFLFCFVLLISFLPVMAQQNLYTIKSDNVTVLYADKYTSTQGAISIQNQGSTWTGTSSMRWTINVTKAGNYKFYILNSVSNLSSGISMRISSQSGNVLNFTLRQTSGLLEGYERDTILGTLTLPQGTQWIELASVNVQSGRSVMRFRGIEMFPEDVESKITAECARAKASRANTDWMLEAKYGVMFHWTTNSINQQGNKVPFDQMVSGFNIQRFANMIVEMGAGYVIFTTGHVVSTFPAPLKSWEKYHPGLTTQRDLIMEMADSLNVRGIKLLLYFPPQFAWVNNTNAGFTTAIKEMLTEIGERYGSKISGYWFDGYYQAAEMYPDFRFDSLYLFCKVGNPNRLIALNSWIYPIVTPWQDYWAGEAAGLVPVPQTRYLTEGSGTGLQSHLLVILEPNWWMDQLGRSPSYNGQTMANYVTQCIRNGVAITINTMIYVDGTILPASMDVFRYIKQAVANVKPVVSIHAVAPHTQRSLLTLDNIQIFGDKILFPSKYAGKKISYAIFDMTGKRLRNANTSKLAVNLRQELKLKDGHYIVKIVSIR
jgi:hypothetical protein